MAAANFDRYDLGDNVREDLSDMIYNIAPTQTPFLTGMGTAKADQNYSEWQIDDLGTIDNTNRRVDGADAGSDTSSKSLRLGNYMQISDKVIRISGRAEVVNKAGRRSELAYQLSKAAKKLKRDMEAFLTGTDAAAAGDSSTAGVSAGLAAWLRTNTARGGAPAADPTLSGGTSGYPNVGPVDATATRAMTETLLRTVIKECYIQGGEPETIMVAPTMKQRLSEYLFTSSARVATLYKDTAGDGTAQATAQGAVDVFVSDYGALRIVPNRFQGHNGTVARERDVFILQMNMWACFYLRNFRTHRLAKTGDAENRQLLVDYGLRSNNEAASGIVADIDETAPMTAS